MKFLTLIAVLFSAQQANAQVMRENPFPELKNRMQNCSYNNNMAGTLYCVGSILLDGMEYIAMRGTMAPVPPAPPAAQKIVAVYGSSDGCSGPVRATLVMTGNYARDLSACEAIANDVKSNSSWSVAINGRCSDIADTSVYGACVNSITRN